MDLKKEEDMKEKFVIPNVNIFKETKVESIFWLSTNKKFCQTRLLVVDLDNVKIANILIEEELVLDHILCGCIRYNSACKIKKFFKCYKYGPLLVYFHKVIRCKAYSGLKKT